MLSACSKDSQICVQPNILQFKNKIAGQSNSVVNMSLSKLTEDFDTYHLAFDAYCRNSRKYEITFDWIDTEVHEVIKAMDATGNDSTRVLSIGPGNGKIEERILKVIQERNNAVQPINTTVVEPSADAVEEYKNRVATEGELHDSSYDWRTETLDDYLEKAENDGIKYHFISAQHSMYYVKNLQDGIKKLYDRLEPGGMMMISMIIAKTSEFTRRDNGPNITSDEFEAACKLENIPIFQDYFIKERIKITACFSDPKEMTEEGRLLLDFFTVVNNFARDATPEALEEVLDIMKSDRFSEKRDGEIYLMNDWKAFVIKRQV